MKAIITMICVFIMLCIKENHLFAQNSLPPLSNLTIPLAKRERELKKFLNDAYMGEKNPATAFVYSFIMPGLGEFYNEDITLGFTLISVGIVSNVGVLLTNRSGYETERYIYLVLGIASRLFSLIEAPVVAADINQARRDAIYELKARGISLTSITPYYSPTNGTGLSLALSF